MKVDRMVIGNKTLAAFLWLSLCSMDIIAAETAKAAPQSPAVASEAIFATVGDVVITREEYDATFASAARGKFYHGKPPDDEIAQLQRDVADQMVANILIFREAKQRGITADAEEVDKILQGYEQRYANSEQWKQNREKLLPGLTSRLERDSLLKKFEAMIRNVPMPDEREINEYYLANPDKFTEPEQIRVAVILLKVDPSSTEAVWKTAEEEAVAIKKRLDGGDEFGSLAKIHSGDPSAQNGGDMGYLHRGMLQDTAQDVLDKAKPGEITPHVHLLEGVAIFRLTDRKISKLNTLEKVHDRARDLLMRDQSEAAWKLLITKLKKETPTKVDQSRFLPLPEKRNEQGNGQKNPGGEKTPG